MIPTTSTTPPPKKVFIVPYRNRPQQKFFFEKYMSFILEKDVDYEIYFSHQSDSRSFNRGATKNIGFLAMKAKYPENYLNMTFIFNDVDTIPFHRIFSYETQPGIVKHHYGFKYALGGIVVIRGSDFERINGFPNHWGWGSEDNELQFRCQEAGVVIDRTEFYPIGSPQILQLFDGISRIISKKENSQRSDYRDGLNTLHALQYTVDSKSTNAEDNIFLVDNTRIQVINIVHFLTLYSHESEKFYHYDLREPKHKILHPDANRQTNRLQTHTEDWKRIPYYPTLQERGERKRYVVESYPQQHQQKPNQRATPSVNIRLGGVIR